MKKFLSCKMGLFPLLLAKWNIKRHTTFVHSVRRLLRESTNTEILIACVCVCFFLPYGQRQSGNTTPGWSWASWWARSECIWLADFFSLLQKAGSTCKYKSSIVKAQSLFRDNCGQQKTAWWSEKNAGFESQADLPLNPTTGSHSFSWYVVMNLAFFTVKKG